jgi:hypothetical protein
MSHSYTCLWLEVFIAYRDDKLQKTAGSANFAHLLRGAVVVCKKAVP